jgi:hypothetical protein
MASPYLAGMDMAGGPPNFKKTPLLPSSSSASQSKSNSELKTYVFELELGVSNDDTYPTFSWVSA